jgi:hypothetical protein
MGGVLQKNPNKMKLVKKEGRQDDQPPGYPCRVRLFSSTFVYPSPLLSSRMTVVDVSDFGDLQANVCGDQPTNSNDGNIFMIMMIMMIIL